MEDKERLGFTDEARAYMFASVLENTFRLKAKVVEGPHGWVVAVADHESKMTMLEMSELHKMQGACMVLYDYTISPAQNACADDSKSGEKVPSPESRVAWHDRKNAPLARIESALKEILSRLDQSADTGAQTALATAEAQPDSSGKNGRRSA